MQGAVQQLFATSYVYLAEINGVQRNEDGSYSEANSRVVRDSPAGRSAFNGEQVRFPLVPYGLQGGGYVSETSTWNVPHALDVDKATAKLADTLVPVSITIDLEEDSVGNYSAMSALAENVKQTRIQLGKIENIGAIYGSEPVARVANATGSPALDMDVEDANFDILLPGTTWDILTESSGADPGQGLRRKIASVTETTATTGNVVFSTTAQASDGGSGNITFAATEAIYIPGSYGKVVAGLEQAVAVTGTFEGVDKAANAYWQGVDGRGGVTTLLPLSDSILHEAVRRGMRWGPPMWHFGIGDPAVIELYQQGKYSQVRYDKSASTLKSGFAGVVFEGASKPFPLVKELYALKGKVRLIDKESIDVYANRRGPYFIQDDGSMWRRLSRTNAKEADLLDRWQVAYKACNRLVFLNNLEDGVA